MIILDRNEIDKYFCAKTTSNQDGKVIVSVSNTDVSDTAENNHYVQTSSGPFLQEEMECMW